MIDEFGGSRQLNYVDGERIPLGSGTTNHATLIQILPNPTQTTLQLYMHMLQVFID